MPTCPIPPILEQRVATLALDYGPELVAHAAVAQAETLDEWVQLGERLLREMGQLRSSLGSVRQQITRYAREDRESEAIVMSTIDELRVAQGGIATVVAGMGLELREAADRITNMIASLQTAGQVNDVTRDDVTALQETETRLRAMSEAIAQLGQDPSSEVPPPEEADPIDDLPGTPPVPEEPTVPADPTEPTPDQPAPDEPAPDAPTPDEPTPDEPTPDPAPPEDPPAEPATRGRRAR